MYWIGAAGPAKAEGAGTDFETALAGHVTITPLQVDLTDHARLGYWQQSLVGFDKGSA
jgi:5'-nucleotidase